jgi:CDP-diacylglycerol--glycerol-3-phosphate 3-phosphatidyltransferase
VWNLPNAITIGRLLLIPPVLLLVHPTDPLRNAAAAGLFALAGVLDAVDGWLARRYALVTVFGKFADPLADKIMVMAALIVLVEARLVAVWVAVVLLTREFYISGLRLLAVGDGVVIAAGSGGKLKTALQLVALVLLLLRGRYPVPAAGLTLDTAWIGARALELSLLISVWSAWDYTQSFRAGLRARGERAGDGPAGGA